MIFKTGAWLFGAFAVFHVINFFHPFDESPVWRNTLFIFINGVCIYGILKRPVWFFYFSIILCVQQVVRHGSDLISYWEKTTQPHWPGVVVLLLIPFFLICIWEDFLEKRSKK